MFKSRLKKILALLSVFALVTTVNVIPLSASEIDFVEEKPVHVVFDESVQKERWSNKQL